MSVKTASDVGSPSRSLGLRRGLEILCLFSDERPEWGVSDIARAMGIHKSRVHRAVKTLEDMGFLQRNPRTRKYLMGVRAFVVGTLAGRLIHSVPEARHLLRALSDEVGATVSLRRLAGDDLLVIDCYETLDHLPSHWPVGMRVPFNFGAGGKILAAFLPPADIKRLITTFGLPRYTGKSITDPKVFLREAKLARAQGYAVSDGENLIGSFSVAAPVLAQDGTLRAVIVASKPRRLVSKRSREAFAASVVRTAQQVAALMAGRDPLRGAMTLVPSPA